MSKKQLFFTDQESVKRQSYQHATSMVSMTQEDYTEYTSDDLRSQDLVLYYNNGAHVGTWNITNKDGWAYATR